ncbi:hypothetical protein FACS1894199_10550 [Bacteroidia bacterium]|nr:hypothetical protein FACS1894199_10550 [Bacteroidia bacterium]
MKKRCIVFGLLAFGSAFSVTAQENHGVDFSVGADVVSSYVFRGTYQEKFSGINVQPTASLSAYGFSLGAWGSTNLFSPAKELDLIVGYEIAGISLAITDYWIVDAGTTYFNYDKNNTAHTFEATVAYTLPEAFPLSISWNTYFAGADDIYSDGDNDFSTYVGLTYPFSIKSVNLAAELAFTPWKGAYSDKLNVVNINLKAAKEIRITNDFSLPVFAQYIINPYLEDANFVFGLSLGL